MTFPLSIELVPEPLWDTNPRTLMGQERWDRLRRHIYAMFKYRCIICNGSGQMEAHEVWTYDDGRRVQYLLGFIALCILCHRVKHLGNTEVLAIAGKLDLREVVKHFLDVNRCGLGEFAQHREEAFDLWSKRSAYRDWKVDWSLYREEPWAKSSISRPMWNGRGSS